MLELNYKVTSRNIFERRITLVEKKSRHYKHLQNAKGAYTNRNNNESSYSQIHNNKMTDRIK